MSRTKTYTSVIVNGRVQIEFQFPQPRDMDGDTWAALSTLLKRKRTVFADSPNPTRIKAIVVTELNDDEGSVEPPMSLLDLVEAFVKVQKATEQNNVSGVEDGNQGLGSEFELTSAEAAIHQCDKILTEITRLKTESCNDN